MRWGGMVWTPRGEIGEVGQIYTLEPDNIDVADVTVDCLFSLWRVRDLRSATDDEVARYRAGERADVE